MNFVTWAANSAPSSLPYLIPIEYIASARPINPRPILLALSADILSCGTAGTYLFADTTLSKNLVDNLIVCFRDSQSRSLFTSRCSARVIEPRQQFSYGPSHCSPQGLLNFNSYK